MPPIQAANAIYHIQMCQRYSVACDQLATNPQTPCQASETKCRAANRKPAPANHLQADAVGNSRPRFATVLYFVPSARPYIARQTPWETMKQNIEIIAILSNSFPCAFLSVSLGIPVGAQQSVLELLDAHRVVDSKIPSPSSAVPAESREDAKADADDAP